MTIDERLDRLTARHEALTQSVELMVLEQRQWQERYEKWQEQYKKDQEENQKMQAKNQVLIAQLIEGVNSLARIAHSHERRITNLERGPE